MTTLSLDAVRALMIAAQGLDDAPKPPAAKQSVRAMIRQIHMLQIDSISVVARSPYLVLWSRLGDYEPDWLDELLAEGALFEHYASANCFLPIEDFRLLLAGSRIFDWRNPPKWLDEHPDIAEKVLNHVRDHGETRHTDFKRADGQKTTWENPKDEQTALTYLAYTGDLLVRRREKFQPVYDLRERVFPDADKLPKVSRADAQDQFVLNTVQAFGVAKAEWVANYYRLKGVDANAALKRLVKQDRLLRVAVEGWKSPGYFHPDHLTRVEAAAQGDFPRSRTTFLSPYDPIICDNGRARDLFGFDYKIEFYFPESQRVYGYFTLPILYNNKLIGRLDPKAHRKEGIFEVKALHLEPSAVVDIPFAAALKSALHAFAAWHNTPQVIVRECAEPDLAEYLSDESLPRR